MDRGIFISMTGAKAALFKQDRISQNIANANTPGYKAVASQTMAVHLNADKYNSRAFAVETSDNTSYAEGSLNKTDNPLNIAVKNDAWFVVKDGERELLTRNGSFTLSPEGILVASDGKPVASEGGVVSIPSGYQIDISSNGEVYATSNEGRQVLHVTIDTPEVYSGYLEASNVNTSSELIDMISTARLFDMHMKIISTFKENDESANKVIQL